MTSEMWREIEGYPGYRISSAGRVIGKRGLMHPAINADGYPKVKLLAKDKPTRSVLVHVLVAAAFIGPRPKGYQINHRDGVKVNNAAMNLEYLSIKEHWSHTVAHKLNARGETMGTAKLRDEDVIAIYRLSGVWTADEIGHWFGLSARHVHHIQRGAYWRHLFAQKAGSALTLRRPVAVSRIDDVGSAFGGVPPIGRLSARGETTDGR